MSLVAVTVLASPCIIPVCDATNVHASISSLRFGLCDPTHPYVNLGPGLILGYPWNRFALTYIFGYCKEGLMEGSPTVYATSLHHGETGGTCHCLLSSFPEEREACNGSWSKLDANIGGRKPGKLQYHRTALLFSDADGGRQDLCTSANLQAYQC